ncbi:hypothetical protein [Bacillus cereus group sp. BfR-BA-01380]|uniref:hypothetical protein n=1 Tax=Bacillus cereus group sp. BfR-BA-01380 TaxID=2920324 RepID=UPI001F58A05B|nr:hypothetical protein [Bacillus cereus group sp. BfR-BA-01380]
MKNLELIFKDVMVFDIKKIFSFLHFNEENIVSSHFFMNDEDLTYQDIKNLDNYFQVPCTCNILINDLEIGVTINKVLIIISFDEVYGDITFNFSEDDWGNIEMAEDKKVILLKEKLEMLINRITYSSILFGYEPAEDEDMQLFTMSK